MNASRLVLLRRWIAAAAIVAVLGVLGIGAAKWSVHAHDDHGWHAHAGQPVPAPGDGSTEGLGDDEHGHGVAVSTFELVASIPTTRRPVAPRPSEVPVLAVNVSPERYVVPALAPPRCAVSRWHPPPPLFADSGTSRVLRASHALLF